MKASSLQEKISEMWDFMNKCTLSVQYNGGNLQWVTPKKMFNLKNRRCSGYLVGLSSGSTFYYCRIEKLNLNHD